MKRWQQFIFVSFLFLGLNVFDSSGYTDLLAAVRRPTALSEPVEPTEITVTPTLPTTADIVQITVDGVWSHGCVPFDSGHTVVGSTISISTTVPGPEIVCGQVVTPWSILVELDRLTAGPYQIDVQGAVAVTSTLTVLGNQIYLPFVSDSASFGRGRIGAATRLYEELP